MKKKVLRALCPFWRKVSAKRIEHLKVWRVEVKQKRGLTPSETKVCVYALLDALLGEDSIGCVVTVRSKS